MSELIMPKEVVTATLNLFPKIEYCLDFEQRLAIKEFLNGTPTDEQQAQVLYICQAIMDTNPVGRDVFCPKNFTLS